MAQQLWQVGIRDSFADGSFAEDKDHPNELDGYFVCSLDLLRTGELSRQLSLLDPDKVWTWGSGVAESLHWLSQAPTSYVASLSCGALRACAGVGCGSVSDHPKTYFFERPPDRATSSAPKAQLSVDYPWRLLTTSLQSMAALV
jgi:hypothetical protein